MTHRMLRLPLACLVAVAGIAAMVSMSGPAGAAATPVGLGNAGDFAVLAGTTVTNTGPTTINGDLATSPGSAIVGFPPGVVNGTMHSADVDAVAAQSDLAVAYNDAAGQTPDAVVAGDLGGLTLIPGVYQSATSLGLTGTLTLDGQGDPNAVFVVQIGSTLVTASNSAVLLVNGVDPCNVFWQVGSSATLGTNSSFVGTVLALTSITATTGATVEGQLLARNGAVTLDTNVITDTACSPAATTTTTTTTTTTAIVTTLPTPTTAPETPGTAAPSTTVAVTTAPTPPPSQTVVELPRTGSGLAPWSASAGVFLALLGFVMLRARRLVRD